MESTLAIKVRRVPRSDELFQPGDYVFIGKREPKRTVEQIPLLPPANRFERFWWNLFGKKFALREVLELLWPEIDTVIVNCPVCNSPCATTRNHKIISIEPLTLEIPLTCPYCKTNTFTIEEGNITLATQ